MSISYDGFGLKQTNYWLLTADNVEDTKQKQSNYRRDEMPLLWLETNERKKNDSIIDSYCIVNVKKLKGCFDSKQKINKKKQTNYWRQ